MVFRINNIDFSDYIKNRGFKRTRSDIDGPEAGRTMDGIMHRERVAKKIRLDISCRPLVDFEAGQILSVIEDEYGSVTYTDPVYGVITKEMYSNNNPASYRVRKNDGREYWDGIEFPLVER